MGGGEAVDPLGGGGEGGAVSGLAGPDRESGGQVGFPGPGRAQENGVLLARDEVQGTQVGELLARQAAQMGDVEFLQGLDRGEVRGADAALAAVGLAGGDLALQDRDQVLGVGPVLGSCALGQALSGVQQDRGFHRARVEGQVGGGLLGGSMPGGVRSRSGGGGGRGGVGGGGVGGGAGGGGCHQSSSWPAPPWMRVNIRS